MSNEIDNGPLPVLKETIKLSTAPAIPVADATELQATETVPGVEGDSKEPLKGDTAEEKPKDEGKMAARWAALNKQESEVRKQKAEVKKEMAQFHALKKDFDGVKENPANLLKIAQSMGISFEDLAKAILNDDKPTEEYSAKRVKEELETFKKQQLDEAQAKQADLDRRTIDNFKRELNSYIDSNAEIYELTKLHNAHETVYEVIEVHFEKTGQVMPKEQAAKMVEEYYEKEAQKLLAAKKFAPKASTANEIKDKGEPGVREKVSSKSLTNKKTAETGKPVNRKMTDDERFKQAAGLIQWK